LDAVRVHGGPGANVQITSGEVTLLPVARLLRVVRYAIDIGLDPMVMTHGQTFADDPTYLHRLMREGGLRKVSIHIDSTQRGRAGVPRGATELDLMAVRDRFAELVRDARRITGRALHAAHTMTVGAENLGAVPDVVRWTVRNADAFRLLGLNPVAEVGRTRLAGARSRDRLRGAVACGLGPTAPATFDFGHPDCNDIVLGWALGSGPRFRTVLLRREGSTIDADFLRRFRLHGLTLDDAPRPVAAARLARHLVRHPIDATRWAAYAARRVLDERDWIPDAAGALLRGRRVSVRPFAVMVHHFMDSATLETATGRARLAACGFRVPVAGRMVPMCELNATALRAELYAALAGRASRCSSSTNQSTSDSSAGSSKAAMGSGRSNAMRASEDGGMHSTTSTSRSSTSHTVAQ